LYEILDENTDTVNTAFNAVSDHSGNKVTVPTDILTAVELKFRIRVTALGGYQFISSVKKKLIIGCSEDFIGDLAAASVTMAVGASGTAAYTYPALPTISESYCSIVSTIISSVKYSAANTITGFTYDGSVP
jgi:hypothetical protein